jgi:hypothetical protein
MVKKDLMIIKSEAQNRRKKTVPAEKRFASAMASFPLEADGSTANAYLVLHR